MSLRRLALLGIFWAFQHGWSFSIGRGTRWCDSRLGGASDGRCSRRPRCPPPTALLEGLTERVSNAVKSIGGTQRITEQAVEGALKDVKRALLDSDVNLQVANRIVQGVKERAIGVEVTKGVTAEQQFIKLMYDELVEIMGNGSTPLAVREDERPTVVLMAGLQGAGKTTSAGKLALACTTTSEGGDTGRGALLAAADVYRPAAIKQAFARQPR